MTMKTCENNDEPSTIVPLTSKDKKIHDLLKSFEGRLKFTHDFIVIPLKKRTLYRAKINEINEIRVIINNLICSMIHHFENIEHNKTTIEFFMKMSITPVFKLISRYNGMIRSFRNFCLSTFLPPQVRSKIRNAEIQKDTVWTLDEHDIRELGKRMLKRRPMM